MLIEDAAGSVPQSHVTWLSYDASDEDRRRHLENFQAESGARELLERMASKVAVIIAGRDGYDAMQALLAERDDLTAEPYGGAWSGTEIILTHRPEELADDPTVTAWNCSITEAIERAQEIAGDRGIQIISADIARQALENDFIDELQVFVAPVFLGDGTRIFDVPGGSRIDWELIEIDEPNRRSFGRTYRPLKKARSAIE